MNERSRATDHMQPQRVTKQPAPWFPTLRAPLARIAAMTMTTMVWSLAARAALPQDEVPPDATGALSMGTAGPIPLRFGNVKLQVLGVRWGWHNRVSREQFAPVWLDISSGPDAFAGTVELRHPQDKTQSSSMVVPFSTTPNRVTSVELSACLPTYCQQAKFTITSDAGKFREIECVVGDSEGQLPLPLIDYGTRHVGIVGNTGALGGSSMSAVKYACTKDSIGAVADRLAGPQPDQGIGTNALPEDIQKQTSFWSFALPLSIPPAELPTAWLSYEGLACLVVQESEALKASPQSHEALKLWVGAGGRLVILLDQAGQRWRELLPDICPEEAAEALPMREHTLDRFAIAGTDPSLATRATCRLLRVSPTGKSLGWKTLRWTVGEGNADAARASAGEEDTLGAVAFGPAGLGMVMLVGADPSKLTATVSVQTAGALWRGLLTKIIRSDGLMIKLNESGYGANPWSQWGGQASSPDRESGEALRVSLDSVVAVPRVGPALFWGLLVALVLLVAAVGPLGRLLLKKRDLLRKSWLFALGSIALTSVVATTLPMFVRSGRSDAGACSIIDVVCDIEGEPIAAWATLAQTYFAGRPSECAPDNDALGPGCWWRGVSVTQSYGGGDSILKAAFTTLLAQTAPGEPRGAKALPLGVGQWQLRTMLAHAPNYPLENLPRITNLTIDQGRATVSIAGLSQAQRAESLLICGGPTDTDLCLNTAPQPIVPGTPATLVAQRVASASDRESSLSAFYSQNQAVLNPSDSARLVRARDRTDAIDVLARAGWRVVMLFVKDQSRDPSTKTLTTRGTFYRFLLPPPLAAPDDAPLAPNAPAKTGSTP